jgi:alpha-L-fucosidase
MFHISKPTVALRKGTRRRVPFALLLLVIVLIPALSQSQITEGANKPERLEWFQDQGLGLFIHWSVDSQLGVIISHSLAGASDEYVHRFYTDLPQTFNPTKFDPEGLARIARVAGFRYMVFTTKHHNGFCMWDTKTVDFNSVHTPYGKDITAELFSAFREQKIPVGAYFSPDDFLWLHQNGKQIQRLVPEVQPSANPGLMARDQQQVTELMSHYGPVSFVFFDGEAKGLREIAWKLQPDTVVTRGAIETPEQNVPGAPLPGAWEANMTLGTAWGYQPTEERYKSIQELLDILIHTRARGGNLLLNVGLEPDGSLPIDQEQRLQTLGAWMFVNSDAIYATRPWVVTNEGDLWFTRSKDHRSLYVIVDDDEKSPLWKRGARRDFVLKTVRATPGTTISVLGQNDQLVEYRPGLDAHSRVHQEQDGLHISVVRAQRLRDSDQWPFPTVIKLTDVDEAFTPPSVHTLTATQSSDGNVTLTGDWKGPADTPGVRFSFDYRIVTGEDTQSRLHAWEHLAVQPAGKPGNYTQVFHPNPGESYEYRAVLLHPLLTIYGEPVRVKSANNH